ncbi:MAG: hypothetical protein C4K49_07860 [Candidatus Thorarchaeota archaeon]|nr:MAG: hypothetical protein C4K49_07860 [Candidatus Thorarchaeota archaeon]
MVEGELPVLSSQERTQPGPYRIVIGTGFGILLSALDSSVVNVSLVTMSVGFGVEIEQIEWVVLAYLVVLTAAMPLMGKLGDRSGKKKVFQTGMALFIMGSAACAMSSQFLVLIAFRVFQAVGASMMTANGLALVTYFTTPDNRGRAIGLNSVILASALGFGPVVGGILTQFFGWPSVFLINIPLGLIGLIVGAVIIQETDPVKETRFDLLGGTLFFVVLFTAVFMLSLVDIVNVSVIMFLALIPVTTFVVFLHRERTFSSPIIPTRVLADRRISAGFFSAFLSFMAMSPVSFLMPFLLQEALGFSQSLTGVYLTAYPLTIAVMGPVSGFISERVQARRQTVIGLCFQLGGLVLLGVAMPNIPLMFLSVVVSAVGTGLFTVANSNFMMTTAPRNYMGVISALTNVSRTAAFSIATALSTAVFVFFFVGMNPEGLTSGPEYVNAYIASVRLAVWTFSLLAGIAVIISALRGVNAVEMDRQARRISAMTFADRAAQDEHAQASN